MKSKINLLMATVLAFSMLTACGTPTEPVTNTDETPSDTSEVAEQINEEGTVLMDGIVELSTGEKQVTHDFGETIVPADPQSIVSIHLMDSTLATEVPIKAMTTYYNYSFNDIIDARGIERLDVVEHDNSVNMEQLLAQEPDLIIVNAGGIDETTYDRYSQIAPTVPFYHGIETADFLDTMRRIGAITNQSEQVETKIAEYEDFIETSKATLSELMGDSSLAMLRVKGKELRLYPSEGNDMSGFLYADLGLKAEELVIAQSTADELAISFEILPQLESDYVVFLPGYSVTEDVAEGEEKAFTDEILTNPLWEMMPANQAGNVFTVDGELWGNGGILATKAKTQNLIDLMSAE